MARIFKQRWTKARPDGRRGTKQSRKWYVEYRDADGIVRRVPGYTDRKAPEAHAADLERQAARQASGLIDRYAEHRKRPLTQHVDDWQSALAAKGASRGHIATTVPRVRKVLDGCGFTFWPDLSASRLQAYLAELRNGRTDKPGLSVQSINFYLAACKAFCRWAVRDGRAPDSPLSHLQGGNVRTDRRHDRRALDANELRRRAAADADGRGPAGQERAGPLRHDPGRDSSNARWTRSRTSVSNGSRAWRSPARPSSERNSRPRSGRARPPRGPVAPWS